LIDLVVVVKAGEGDMDGRAAERLVSAQAVFGYHDERSVVLIVLGTGVLDRRNSDTGQDDEHVRRVAVAAEGA
jgi:hypothetical protein